MKIETLHVILAFIMGYAVGYFTVTVQDFFLQEEENESIQ